MSLPEPPLMMVTDRAQASRALVDIAAAAVGAGCRWISVREKDMAEMELSAVFAALAAVVEPSGARVLVHGSAECAARIGVSGVHLPAGSDAAAARALLGEAALIGLSVHAGDVSEHAADYLMLGPVFSTSSKPGYGPELGLEGLAAFVAGSRVPVIAIGGIDAMRVAGCIAAGAAGIAVMGGLMRADDPGAETAGLLAALSAARLPVSA